MIIEKNEKKKQEIKENKEIKRAIICLYIVSYSIRHLYHLLRVICWVYLSLGFK